MSQSYKWLYSKYLFFFQVKNHRDNLTSIAISKGIGKAASCGDNTVKVHELHDLKETSNVINIDDERGLDNIGKSNF